MNEMMSTSPLCGDRDELVSAPPMRNLVDHDGLFASWHQNPSVVEVVGDGVVVGGAGGCSILNFSQLQDKPGS